MNNCGVCKWLVRYYTKELKKFNKTEYGWCGKKGEIVCTKDCCEHFGRRNVSHNIRYGLQRSLNDLLTQLSTIRQIIEEEQNDREE